MSKPTKKHYQPIGKSAAGGSDPPDHAATLRLLFALFIHHTLPSEMLQCVVSPKTKRGDDRIGCHPQEPAEQIRAPSKGAEDAKNATTTNLVYEIQ